MSKIIITVGPKGEREVKAEGIQGDVCKSATKPFEDLLGGKVVSDTPTAEMQMPPKLPVAGGLTVG